MIWSNKLKALPLLFGVVVSAAGCSDIRYVDHANTRVLDRQVEEPSAFSRQVDFHLDRAFYETPPRCVMIMPIHAKKKIDPKTAGMVEDAVSRYAANLFDKTITARHVKFASRKRAFDPNHDGDRKRLGRALRCDTQLEIKTVGIEDFYAVVWTDLSVAIQLTLVRSRDASLLWRGKHKARRADGGLPIGILSVGAGTFSAGKLASDRDVLPSMIDDAVRRVMASLPDTRRF